MQFQIPTRALFLVPALLFAAVSAKPATITFTASMLGSNETPPNTSTATGLGTFIFDTVAQNISYSISYSGLTSSATAAHIHFGAPGISGPIILPFSPSPTGTAGLISGLLTTADLINQASSGVVTFTDIYNAAISNNLYANIHDPNYPAGEIRGQLVGATATPEPATGLLSTLGIAAVPLFLLWRNRARQSRMG